MSEEEEIRYRYCNNWRMKRELWVSPMPLVQGESEVVSSQVVQFLQLIQKLLWRLLIPQIFLNDFFFFKGCVLGYCSGMLYCDSFLAENVLRHVFMRPVLFSEYRITSVVLGLTL